jgi:hypothetical protein
VARRTGVSDGRLIEAVGLIEVAEVLIEIFVT